jgi:hypothetical protein
VILQIDVTVTGPGWVSTGSATVDVTDPSAQKSAPADDENARMRKRVQAQQWGVNRA